jgi:hypothetical protein
MSLVLFSEEMFKKGIRYDSATKCFSVLDVVKIVTGCDQDNASRNLARIVEKYQSIEDGIIYVKFPGRGPPSPVACLKTIMEIAFLLPGRNAQEFRRVGATTLCRALGGDLGLIDEIRRQNLDIAGTLEQEAFLEGTGVSQEEANRSRALSDESIKLENARKALEIYRELKAEANSEEDETVRAALLSRAAHVMQIDVHSPISPTLLLSEPASEPESKDEWMKKEIPRMKKRGASPEMVEAFLESGWIQFGDEKHMPYKTFRNMFGAFANEKGYAGPKTLSPESTSGPFRKRNLKVERTHLPYDGKRHIGDFLIGADMYRPPNAPSPYLMRSAARR